MKKILFIAVCVMSFMTSLSAQDGAKNLSQGQWNHGLAVGAQWIAMDLGFAQPEDKVIARTNENYSLDDLKVMYGSRANWVKYYDKLKAHENQTGDVEKLVEAVATEYEKGAVIKNKVKSDVEKYNANHTGAEVGAVPAGEPAPTTATEQTAETTITAADSTQVQDADAAKKQDTKEDGEESHGGHGLLYVLTVLGIALGALGAFMGLQAHKEAQQVARDNSDDIDDLKKQIDKLRAALKAAPAAAAQPALQREEKKKTTAATQHEQPATRPINFGGNGSAEQPKKKEKPAEPAQPAAKPASNFGEPRILFMAKPDEDDNFSRSSASYEPGNSIFELTTMDGKSGSFTVINKADAHKLALLVPGDNLTRACSGNNIQSAAGKTRIVTDRAGRAQLENGKWHIVVKAIVHYE